MSHSLSQPVDSTPLALLLSRRGALPPAEGLRILVPLAAQVEALHQSGRLHRAISIEAVFIEEAPFNVFLAPPADGDCAFGGPESDPEFCPPELRRGESLRLPADFAEARKRINEAGISCKPARIDVYQLGTLLCRLVTGASVESYLRSPASKRRMPAPLQALVDRALGYDGKDCYSDVAQFAADIQALANSEMLLDPASGVGESESEPCPQDADTATCATPQSSATGSTAPSGSQPRRPVPDELPFAKLAHYEIIGWIGSGGMGDVFEGYERSLDRTVAIKVLPEKFSRDDDFVRRFFAEATAAARLSHPNIVAIHFIGEENRRHFFAMQYVEGESLAERLARQSRLSVDETLSIVEQVLAGLGAAHRHGIVHRDIKPGNILIDRNDERILLADFGLVKTLENSGSRTATGVVMGTADYISPEQGRRQPVDGRSDLYSLGVLMYRMLSGRLPFEADSPTAMTFQHAYEAPQPLQERVPQIPPALVAVVDRLLAKSPHDRYQSAEDVLADLRLLRKGKQPTPARLPSSPPARNLEPGRTAIIQAPRLPEPALPQDEWSGTLPPGWWQRTRDWLLGTAGKHAPEILRRLQNTQQQMDGAIAEYEHRRNRLRQLEREANGVLQELRRQAEEHSNAAREVQRGAQGLQDEQQQAAAEEQRRFDAEADSLLRQVAEQEDQLAIIRSDLVQANARLQQLITQRDLLKARLKAAQAAAHVDGGQISRRRLSWIRAALAAAGLCLIILLIVARSLRPVRTVEGEASAGGPPADNTTKMVVPVQLAKQGTGPTGARVNNFRDSDAAGSEPEIDDLPPDASDIAVAAFNNHNGLLSRIVHGRPYQLQADVQHRGFGEPGWTSSWEGTPSLAVVDDAVAREGDGALHIRTDQANASRTFSAQSGRFAVEQYVRFGAGGSLVARVREHSHGPFSKTGIGPQWSAGPEGKFSVLDGTGDGCPTGECVVEDTGFSWKADEWYKVTVVIDVPQQTYEFFVNGVRYDPPDPLGFRGRPKELDELHFATPTEAGAHIDVLRLYHQEDAPGVARRFIGHTAPVADVKFSTDGRQIISAAGNTIQFWKLSTGEPVESLTTDSYVTCLALSPDGVLLASGEVNGTIRLWNAQSRLPMRQLPGHSGRIDHLAVSPDGTRLVSAGRDGTVRLWNPEEGIETDQLAVNADVFSTAFSPRTGNLLLHSGDALRAWKPGSSDAATLLTDGRFSRQNLTVSRDNRLVATSDPNGAIMIRDIESGNETQRLVGHGIAPRSVKFFGEDRYLISAGQDKTICIWHVESANPLHVFRSDSWVTNHVDVSPDGRFAISGGGSYRDAAGKEWDQQDYALRLWRLPELN